MLEKDSDLKFPQSIILKASAGSGKTHALTKRYVQLLLSGHIEHNELSNVLAITFSNNAAREMRERILLWLKDIYFKDEDKIKELGLVRSLNREELINKAEVLIDKILINYSDFGVKTIDSFMLSIYKASAIDLGYSPDFEIVMNSGSIVEYAFELFWRKLSGPAMLEDVLDLEMERRKSDDTYPWDPSRILLSKTKEIYDTLSSIGRKVLIPDNKATTRELEVKIRDTAYDLEGVIENSGLVRSKRSSFPKILRSVRDGRFSNLIGTGIKSVPVNKPKTINYAYNSILDMWADLGGLIGKYHELYAASYYVPYLRVYQAFINTLEEVKKKEALVFIEDVSKNLCDYLNRGIVPDVYFRLGETIYHYMVDEFQDTSPIQWSNLFPLIENSISQGGSFFAVGDTKQSIYGFRNADYRIMKAMESASPFPASRHEVKELDTNYRSYQGICDFNKKVFLEELADNPKYADAAARSGLTDYKQKIRAGHEDLGRAAVCLLEKDEEVLYEKRKIQELISEAREKGYGYSDIAVLTFKNEQVVNVTAWLDEKNIPFISYSSLDIRRRRLTGEIISLLKFLDSPVDDLSLVAFLLGDVFSKTIKKDNSPVQLEELRAFLFKNRNNRPLYKAFQDEFSGLWQKYFSRLFKTVGYMPLYDLVCDIYRMFEVFHSFSDEQATVVKILEVIKDFEATGKNNLRDFIKYTEIDDIGAADWNLNIPDDIEAVKVMTVHKAKGLGFPVVIALVYNDSFKGFSHIVAENEDGVSLLKINKKIADMVPAYGKLYQEEAGKNLTDKLNSLYVGFTRAKQELYVLGVGKRDKYPLDFLPDQYVSLSGNTPLLNVPEPSPPGLKLFCHGFRGTSAQQTDEMVKKVNFKEKRRGDFIHKALYYIDYLEENFEPELDRLIENINHVSNITYPMDAVKKTIGEFFLNNKAKEYFLPKSGRTILKEQEVTNEKGDLFIMDRVVIDKDVVTVIDFKTGVDHDEDIYKTQVRNYVCLLKEIYPDKKVEGFIAYIDLNEIRGVR